MRIKKISDNEVSVYLTASELEDFELRMDGGVPREESLHGFLYNIIELVRNETDFDPFGGGRLVVEAMHTTDGMKLRICRLGGRRKLTRAEFKRVKKISAKKPDPELEMLKAYAELLGLLGALESTVPTEKRCSFTFVFDGFKAMEQALIHINDNELGKCALYRSGGRYAIVVRTKRSERVYNVLTEFALISHDGSVLAADIAEGWQEVARGAKLVEMAQAVRDMR
ncbi:MAG: adaptor protein MecA [Clostridia bacterium]|nr:adaptor protein MecA [Clostridia bacterium]